MSNSASGDNKPAAKKSKTETGHAVNLSNFGFLIKTVTRLKEKYNPSNEDITIPSLQKLYDKAKNSLDNCTLAETDFDNVTGSRSTLFKNMKKLSAKAHRAFKSSKSPRTAKDDAMTIMNKLRGKASKPKKKEILAEDAEAAKSISNSQQSYVQLIEHFKALRDLVSSHGEYKPNEAELKQDALTIFEKQLNTENDNVGNAIANWRSIRRNRSKTFYTADTGMVDIALNVKEYIASVFETPSAEFKEVNKIKFRNFKK